MKPTIKIVVSEHGPYLVYGGPPLAVETIAPNAEGGSWEWERGRSFDVKSSYALCRCGHSKTKPFCDGTHKAIAFDGQETASRVPFANRAKRIEGPELILQDAEDLCSAARFCDNFGSIWNLVSENDSPDARKLAIHEAARCPSGRLVLGDRKTGAPVEPEFEPSIGVVEDPAENCSGPLAVRGGIPIESHAGAAYEVRNRVTLCRCGESKNKPFCDGSHIEAGFNDGLT